MMKEGYKEWLVNDDPKKMKTDSQTTYIDEITHIESDYSVDKDIDIEYSNDRCEKLLGLIKNDNKYLEATRNNKCSYVNKYIEFRKSFDETTRNIYIYPDSENCIEGAKTSVLVNKYERDPVARQKCIDKHGYRCHVCNLDFEERYGKIGKGFIHVHHLTPLSESKEEHSFVPEKDLLPVCPNCHAMLHRKVNGKSLSVDELKDIIK